MNYVRDLSGHYPDVIDHFYGFEDIIPKIKERDSFVLFVGDGSRKNKYVLDRFKNYERRIFLNTEHPCSFTLPNDGYGMDEINYFTHVFTICPLTAEWLGESKYKPILFPLAKKYVQEEKENKEFDVVFFGSVQGKDHLDQIESMKGFKYNLLTLGLQHWNSSLEWDRMANAVRMVTHKTISTFQKWEILRRTKVAPIFNQLYLKPEHVKNIKSYSNWSSNKAFSRVDDFVIPQIKPRITEAALCRTLMLVKREPWNLIERWYSPGREFIYFDDNKELPDVISHITNNWKDYEEIVENAFEKAYNNYISENMIRYILEESK